MNRAGKQTSLKWIQDGRFIVSFALILYFTSFSLIYHKRGQAAAWNRLGVGHLSPSFADLRFMAAAAETKRGGLDPFRRNEFDPWHRPFGYPRIWLLLSPLGLKIKDTLPLAFGLIGAFYLSILLLAGRLRVAEGFIYSLLICSPAAMQAIERANLDLLIFVMLAVAILLMRKLGTRSFWPYSVILWCAILKLYPISAMAVALRDRSRALALAIITGGGLIFVAYLGLIRNDLPAILRNNWAGDIDVSFGSKVLFLRFSSLFWNIDADLWCRVSLAVVVIVGIFAGRSMFRPSF